MRGKKGDASKKSTLFSNLFQFSNLKYLGRAAVFIVGASLTYKALKQNSSNDNNFNDGSDFNDLFALMQPLRQKACIKVTPLHDQVINNYRSINSSLRSPRTAKAISKAEVALCRKVKFGLYLSTSNFDYIFWLFSLIRCLERRKEFFLNF